ALALRRQTLVQEVFEFGAARALIHTSFSLYSRSSSPQSICCTWLLALKTVPTRMPSQLEQDVLRISHCASSPIISTTPPRTTSQRLRENSIRRVGCAPAGARDCEGPVLRRSRCSMGRPA